MEETVFISYAHEDSRFAEKVAENLDRSDLDVRKDDLILQPADENVSLFDELRGSDFVIVLLSENSVDSRWVREEIRVAVENRIRQNLEVICVIHEDYDFRQAMDALPDKLSTPLEGLQATRFDEQDFSDAFRQLVEKMKGETEEIDLYEEYSENKSDNPFRKTRTEYFESSEQIARIFTKPVNMSYEEISNLKPTLIEGGRGSGKTMILKSLQARINILLEEPHRFDSTNGGFFGVYCKLTKGSFSTQSQSITNHMGKDEATVVYTDEMTLNLLKTLLDEISYCKMNGLLELDNANERAMVDNIIGELNLESSSTMIDGLISDLKNELDHIREYIQRTILGETPEYQGLFFDQTDISEISQLVGKYLPGENISIYYLIDEYEVLEEFQTVVVNTMVKRTKQNMCSFKLASKKPGFSNPETLEGEELEEYNDYNSVDLDYNLSDPQSRSNYKTLLKNISRNMLKNDGFAERNIENILEERGRFGAKSTEEVDSKICEIQDITESEWDGLPKEKKQSMRDHYGVAAWYKLLSPNEHREFGGLDDLLLLSSGIVRFYLELIGVAYHKAQDNESSPLQEDGISVEDQTTAAYTVSDYFLEYIFDNISEYGPKIQQLVLDLGDIFEERLHQHSSRVEAARISIRDMGNLLNSNAYELIIAAEEHSVFQRRGGRGGMRPRSKEERQLREFTLNRVFTPSLRISPRYRWRTEFYTKDIEELLDSDTRLSKKNELMERVKMGGLDEDQKVLEDF